MPAWNALYQVRDFAYRIRSPKAAISDSANRTGARRRVAARSTSRPGEIDPPSQRRRQSNDDSRVLVQYAIQWNDSGPFNSQLNDHHAFINFAEISHVRPRPPEPKTPKLPSHDLPRAGKLIAELATGPDANSFAAESYDALVDAPVEAGKFSDFAFDNQGARFPRSRRRRRMEQGPPGRRSQANHRPTNCSLMGGPPFKEYTFFFHIGPYCRRRRRWHGARQLHRDCGNLRRKRRGQSPRTSSSTPGT